MGIPGGVVVKNPPANTEDARDTGSIPGSGRAPGVGNGNPFQYSCLENSMDRRAWQSMGLQRVGRTEHTHINLPYDLPHLTPAGKYLTVPAP